MEKVKERKRRIEESIFFGVMGEREKKAADMIYNRKQGSKLTGSDVKDLHAAVSAQKAKAEKEAGEMVKQDKQKVETVIQVLEEKQFGELEKIPEKKERVLPLPPLANFEESLDSTVLAKASI